MARSAAHTHRRYEAANCILSGSGMSSATGESRSMLMSIDLCILSKRALGRRAHNIEASTAVVAEAIFATYPVTIASAAMIVQASLLGEGFEFELESEQRKTFMEMRTITDKSGRVWHCSGR
jgi:hypothetical protein